MKEASSVDETTARLMIEVEEEEVVVGRFTVVTMPAFSYAESGRCADPTPVTASDDDDTVLLLRVAPPPPVPSLSSAVVAANNEGEPCTVVVRARRACWEVADNEEVAIGEKVCRPI